MSDFFSAYSNGIQRNFYSDGRHADSGADSGKHGGFIGRNHSDRKDRKDETVSSDIQSDCGSMFRNRLVISTNWYSDYAWRNRFLFRSNDANFFYGRSNHDYLCCSDFDAS